MPVHTCGHNDVLQQVLPSVSEYHHSGMTICLSEVLDAKPNFEIKCRIVLCHIKCEPDLSGAEKPEQPCNSDMSTNSEAIESGETNDSTQMTNTMESNEPSDQQWVKGLDVTNTTEAEKYVCPVHLSLIPTSMSTGALSLLCKACGGMGSYTGTGIGSRPLHTSPNCPPEEPVKSGMSLFGSVARSLNTTHSPTVAHSHWKVFKQDVVD